jgi:hypothetical protein
MAIIGNGFLTLNDRAQRLTGNDMKKAKMIAELLAETNDILEDMPYVNANRGTTHEISMRVGLNPTYWAQMNKGTPAGKSAVVSQKEGTAILETLGLADIRMPNVKELRASEMSAAISALSNDFATELFYGTASDPEGLVGLSARYSSTTAGNGQNIIKAGGVGADNTSIWLIGLGQRAIYGVLPEGYGNGVKYSDQGMHPTADAQGNTFMAHRDLYSLAGGLAIENWQYAVRICNIDVSASLADPANAGVINLMIRAMSRVPTLKAAGIKFGFYMNRDGKQILDLEGVEKSNAYFTSREVEGVIRTDFRGIPLRLCDAILSTESLVV